MLRQHLCSGYVATLSCIICISIATQKVCRDIGLLPLSLTSCCSFVLMLRHDFLVFSIFVVVTSLFCVQLTVLSRSSLLCRDNTSLHYVEIFVATYKSISRPCFSLFSLILCCNIKIDVATWTYFLSLKYVATLGSFVATRPVQQVSVICRDINFLVATKLLI